MFEWGQNAIMCFTLMVGCFKFGLSGRLLLPLVLIEKLIAVVIALFYLKIKCFVPDSRALQSVICSQIRVDGRSLSR